MTQKLYNNIITFNNNIKKYIHMEYDVKYYETFCKKNNDSSMFDFIGSYYVGGFNVPDTARCVVELIKMMDR